MDRSSEEFDSWYAALERRHMADLRFSEVRRGLQALSARFWGTGFLPGEHQGCRLRSTGAPVLYLEDAPGVRRSDRRRMLDLVGALNEREMSRTMDP